MMMLKASSWMLYLAGLASFASLPFVASQDNGPTDLGDLLKSRKDLSTFHSLLKRYPDVLLKLPNYGGVTIAAPTNEAFENIVGTPLNGVWDPEDPKIAVPILEYHILQGTIATGALEYGPPVFAPTLMTSSNWTNVTNGQNVALFKQPKDVVILTSAQGARTTQMKGDVPFSGGLLQIIENVLVPPTQLGPTLEAFQLNAFLGALFATEMMPSLAHQKNITIFAPVDDAVALVSEALTGQEKESNGSLKRVAGYHVVPNAVLSTGDLKNGTVLKTSSNNANGEADTLTARREGNNLYINSAQVMQSDILLANGVLHLIGGVLSPDAPSVRPDPEAEEQAPVYPAQSVSEGAPVPFTSEIPCSTDCPSSASSSSVATSGMGSSTVLAGGATTTSGGGSELQTDSPGAAGSPRCAGAVMGMAAGVLGAGVAAFL